MGLHLQWWIGWLSFAGAHTGPPAPVLPSCGQTEARVLACFPQGVGASELSRPGEARALWEATCRTRSVAPDWRHQSEVLHFPRCIFLRCRWPRAFVWPPRVRCGGSCHPPGPALHVVAGSQGAPVAHGLEGTDLPPLAWRALACLWSPP